MLPSLNKVYYYYYYKGNDKGLQVVLRGYEGLQEVRRISPGVTRGYPGLQEVTGGYKGLQWVKGGYKGLQELRECLCKSGPVDFA